MRWENLTPGSGHGRAAGSNGSTRTHCSSVRSDGYPPPEPLTQSSTTARAHGNDSSQTRSQRQGSPVSNWLRAATG